MVFNPSLFLALSTFLVIFASYCFCSSTLSTSLTPPISYNQFNPFTSANSFIVPIYPVSHILPTVSNSPTLSTFSHSYATLFPFNLLQLLFLLYLLLILLLLLLLLIHLSFHLPYPHSYPTYPTTQTSPTLLLLVHTVLLILLFPLQLILYLLLILSLTMELVLLPLLIFPLLLLHAWSRSPCTTSTTVHFFSDTYSPHTLHMSPN